ncbi:D-alanyl-D-alanine carboxypeptidase family protein [Thalassobacillus hwangdonensis]|uniref:serine-type D-Ala-D-Ala carboxypeptidase n=1 Tax=Thalassobacillus hwangdonensis TaxID=546108 RepID=A0ABW3KXE2_9BACI
MKKMMIYLIAAAMVSVISVPVTKGQESNNIQLADDAKSAVLLESSSGEVLFDKNSREELPPASMTKIMTMILIMEALKDGKLKLDEDVRVSEKAASMGGSQIFLEAGEVMKAEDLLKGVAVASGNDASVALAERISGSEEAFVAEMNAKAKEMGLKNTQFKNTTGLPEEGHYSSAYDMAMMARELLNHESITGYTGIYEDYLRKGQKNEFWLVNTNKLVRHYEGVDGLKTGYTNEAKYCLTATAMKDGMRMIAVVMGADTPKERNANIAGMLDYAFNQFSTEKLFDKNYVMDTVNLPRGDREQLNIVTSKDVTVLKKKGQELKGLTTAVAYEEDLQLPIKKGDHLGKLIVQQGGKTVTEVPLVAEKSVDQAGLWQLYKRSLGDMMIKR